MKVCSGHYGLDQINLLNGQLVLNLALGDAGRDHPRDAQLRRRRRRRLSRPKDRRRHR